jgi:GTP cyclohydrolase I
MDSQKEHNKHHTVHHEIDASEFNEDGLVKNPLAMSCAQSRYTEHPTIGFGRLSYLSK